MKQLTVAIDLDSTLYDLCTPWLAYIRDELGEDTSDGFLRWDTHLQFEKSGNKVYDFLHLEGAFYNLKPLPGAIEAIKRVSALGVKQVFITTCTTKRGPWEKQQAILRDFPELAKNVLITSGVKDVIDADLLVDDAPHNIEDFGETRPLAFTAAIPYAYNNHSDPDFWMFDWRSYEPIVHRVAEMVGVRLTDY